MSDTTIIDLGDHIKNAARYTAQNERNGATGMEMHSAISQLQLEEAKLDFLREVLAGSENTDGRNST